MADERLRVLADGRYEYTPKRGTPFTLTAEALVRRLVALVPPAGMHRVSYHGVYAPHARLRPVVVQRPEARPTPDTTPPSPAPGASKQEKPSWRIDWAALHWYSFGHDVFRCPCGARHRVVAVYTTRAAAQARLLELGHPPDSLRLPSATAGPQLAIEV